MSEKLSGMFKLNLSDITKGLVVAVFAAVLGALQQLVVTHGLDFASYDWSLISTVVVGAFTSYISKNFLSNDKGKVLGKIG